MTTAADHANTVRQVLSRASERDAALAALDALQAKAETAEGAVSREAYAEAVWTLTDERDAAVQAAETLHREIAEDYVLAGAYHEQRVRAEAAEQAAETAEARITELHATLERTNESYLAAEQAAEQAHAALDAIEAEPEDPLKVQAIARAALAGNQPPRDSGKPQSHP